MKNLQKLFQEYEGFGDRECLIWSQPYNDTITIFYISPFLNQIGFFGYNNEIESQTILFKQIH